MGKLGHNISTGNEYTHSEWTSSNLDHIHNADAARHAAEKIRAEAGILMEDRVTKTIISQQEVTAHLGDRVRDIKELREDLQHELQLNEEETEHLVEAKRHLDYAHSQTRRPLTVSLECLHQRENRVGIDVVKDGVERNLKREIENIKKYQAKMKILSQLIEMQITDNKDKQDDIKQDIDLKDEAFMIDQKCHVININSDEIQKCSGVERVDPEASIPVTWKTNSLYKIKNSATTREVSIQLRNDVDVLINDAAKDMLHHWNVTNREFNQRISETEEIKKMLSSNVVLVEKDIMEMDCLIDQLARAKLSKEAPLKLAQTRLSNRSHRPDIEACNDPPHHLLVDEIAIIKESVALIEQKITEAEASKCDLENNKRMLENDIRVKENSLKIDQNKCATLRTNFPYNIRSSVTAQRVERRRFRVNTQI